MIKHVTWGPVLTGDARDFLTLETESPKELTLALVDSFTNYLVPYHTITTGQDKEDARQYLLDMWDKSLKTFVWGTETPPAFRGIEGKVLKLVLAIIESSSFELSPKTKRNLPDMDISRQYLSLLANSYEVVREKLKLRMDPYGDSHAFCMRVLAISLFRLEVLHKPLLKAAGYECKQLHKIKVSTAPESQVELLSGPVSLKRAGESIDRSASRVQVEATGKRAWIPQLLSRVKSWGESKGPGEDSVSDSASDSEFQPPPSLPNQLSIPMQHMSDLGRRGSEDLSGCPSLNLSEWKQCATERLKMNVDAEALKQIRLKFMDNIFFLQFFGEVLVHGNRLSNKPWTWPGYTELLHSFFSRSVDILMQPSPVPPLGGYVPKRLTDPFLRICQLLLRNRDVLGLLVELILRTTRVGDRQAIVQNFSVLGSWFTQCCSLNAEKEVLYFRLLPSRTMPYELLLQSLSLCLNDQSHVVLLHTLIFLYDHLNEIPNAPRSQLCQRLLLHPSYYIPLIGHWSMYVRKAFLCILAYKLTRTTSNDQRVKPAKKTPGTPNNHNVEHKHNTTSKTGIAAKMQLKSLLKGFKDSLKGTEGELPYDEALEKTADFRIAQALEVDNRTFTSNRIFWTLHLSEEIIQTDSFLLSLSSYLYERTAHQYRILTAAPAPPSSPSSSSSPSSPSSSSSSSSSSSPSSPSPSSPSPSSSASSSVPSSSNNSVTSTPISASGSAPPSPPPTSILLDSTAAPPPSPCSSSCPSSSAASSASTPKKSRDSASGRHLSPLPANLPTVNPLGEWLGGNDIDAISAGLPSPRRPQQWVKPTDVSIFSQITKDQQIYLGLGLTEFWGYLQDALAQQKAHAKLNGVVYPDDVNVLPPKGDEVQGGGDLEPPKKKGNPSSKKNVAAAVAVFRRLAGKPEEVAVATIREVTEREKEEERVVFNRQQYMGQETGRLFHRDSPRMAPRIMSCPHCNHLFQFVELHKCPPPKPEKAEADVEPANTSPLPSSFISTSVSSSISASVSSSITSVSSSISTSVSASISLSDSATSLSTSPPTSSLSASPSSSLSPSPSPPGSSYLTLWAENALGEEDGVFYSNPPTPPRR